MKKFSWILLSATFLILSSAIFISCKKINEATELGGGLIPVVDNVNTFDTTLEVQTNNTLLLHDSTKIAYTTDVALGAITNDPVFGKTKAEVYFDILPQASHTYPFYNKDSSTLFAMDSVVLSLSYTGSYGDTSAGSTLSVQVKEIAQSAKFNDSSVYRVDHPDFVTTGATLGSKAMAFNQFKDSFIVVSKGHDTTKTANVLRIKFDNPSLGQRFAGYDTTNGYKNDTIFHSLFSGLKIEATGTNNAIAYFLLSDQTKTKLTFYYRTQSKRTGLIDTAAVDFLHYNFGSRANTIRRDRSSGEIATFLNDNSPTDAKLFIQSGSPGSIATLRIPGLDAFPNKVIHRAEIIVSKLPSASERTFLPQPVLFLDRVNLFDVGASIIDDLASASTSTTTQSLSIFGGAFGADSTYRFNVTRHVQGIVTNKETNYLLRLYSPLYTIIKTLPTETTANRLVTVAPKIAYGRVVLAGGNYPDPAKRLRLRIVYSNIQ